LDHEQIMWQKNCAEIKIALVVITHTIAHINLHSSPKVLRSAPVHPTKTMFTTYVKTVS